jgi:hypothetical protein
LPNARGGKSASIEHFLQKLAAPMKSSNRKVNKNYKVGQSTQG